MKRTRTSRATINTSGQRRITPSWLVAASVGLVGMGTAGALAQDAPEPPLRGPRIHAPDAGARGGSFGQRASDRARPEQSGAMGPVARVLRLMGSDRVDASVRLSEDQQARLRELGKGYRDKLVAYLDSKREPIASVLDRIDKPDKAKAVRSGDITGEQLIGLYEQLPREIVGGRDGQRRGPGLALGNDRPGARPDARPGRSPEARDEMDAPPEDPAANRRSRLRETAQDQRAARIARLSEDQRAALREVMAIRRAGPAAKDLLDAVRGELTEDQRAYLDKQLARQRRAQAQAPRAGVRAQGDAPPPAKDGQLGRISPRLAKMLEGMTPEQQDALAEMIEMRMGREGARRRGERRPPPAMDEVDVPRPDRKQPPQ